MDKLQLNSKMFILYGALAKIAAEIREIGLKDNNNKRYNFIIFECLEDSINYKINNNEYKFEFYIRVPYKFLNNMLGKIKYEVFLVKVTLLRDLYYCSDLNLEKHLEIVNLDLELADDLTAALLLTEK